MREVLPWHNADVCGSQWSALPIPQGVVVKAQQMQESWGHRHVADQQDCHRSGGLYGRRFTIDCMLEDCAQTLLGACNTLMDQHEYFGAIAPRFQVAERRIATLTREVFLCQQFGIEGFECAASHGVVAFQQDALEPIDAYNRLLAGQCIESFRVGLGSSHSALSHARVSDIGQDVRFAQLGPQEGNHIIELLDYLILCYSTEVIVQYALPFVLEPTKRHINSFLCTAFSQERPLSPTL